MNRKEGQEVDQGEGKKEKKEREVKENEEDMWLENIDKNDK